jgi:hypothetical protein
LNTKIFTFQVWLEELKFEDLEFGQLLHTPHLQKIKGGGSTNLKQGEQNNNFEQKEQGTSKSQV